MRLIKPPPRAASLLFARPIDPAYAEQWEYIQNYLKQSDGRAPQEALQAATSVLDGSLIVNSYIDLIRTTFMLKIVPALLEVHPSPTNFAGIAENLKDGLTRYETCFKKLSLGTDEIRRAFQALVRAYIEPGKWTEPIRQWISETIDSKQEEKLAQMYRTVTTIGLSQVFEDEFKSLLKHMLVTELRTNYALHWEEPQLESVVVSILTGPRRLLGLLHLDVSSEQLEEFAMIELAKLRIEELFDIIVDFPNSIAALQDLKHCLESTAMRAHLVTSYQKDCQSRLLHPGANTPDIITIYISTIKSFLLLDPPGVLLDKVARPIRKYLRERTDTIRSIMSSLLGEVDNDLAQELALHDPDKVDVPDEDDPNWLPDPIDAAPDYMKNKASDIIGSLISIYENKEVFVRELQALLADRLLAITDYNIDQELRNLEMLKIRFGESMMSVCDVMLKDVTDSKRIDAQVHAPKPDIPGYIKTENVVHTTVLSRLYWPMLTKFQASQSPASDDEKGLRLPSVLNDMLKEYSTEFTKLKAQRSLVFQKEMGHVRVALHLEDRDFDMMVTPSHAATIYLFNSTDGRSVQKTLSQVSEELRLPAQESRRNLAFWMSQQILAASSSPKGEIVYSVLETLPLTSTTGTDTVGPLLPVLGHDDPGAEAEPLPAEEQEESTYWQFVVGMLTNIGALPADRIQSMLGMFAPNYDQTLEQLKATLTAKVRAGEVELKGGLYKLLL